MMIGANLVLIDKLWPDFLVLIDGTTKSLGLQFEEDADKYDIFALDQQIFYQCQIFKAGKEPIGSTAQQITDNTAYRTAFEANWKNLGNGQLIVKTSDIGGGIGPGTQKGPVSGRVATSATAQVPIRATAYTEAGGAAQRSLVSSSANDAAGGTGARIVRIIYLDGQMNGPFIEDVTLNGTSSVNTVATNIRFIEALVVVTSGNNTSNVGVISLKDAGGGGATYGTIAAGDNVALWAHHYVPAGRTMNLRCISGAVRGAVAGLITAKFKNPLVAPSIERPVGIPLRVASGAGETVREMHVQVSLKGPGRLVLYVTPDATTSVTWFGAFEFNEEIA